MERPADRVAALRPVAPDIDLNGYGLSQRSSPSVRPGTRPGLQQASRKYVEGTMQRDACAIWNGDLKSG